MDDDAGAGVRRSEGLVEGEGRIRVAGVLHLDPHPQAELRTALRDTEKSREALLCAEGEAEVSGLDGHVCVERA